MVKSFNWDFPRLNHNTEEPPSFSKSQNNFCNIFIDDNRTNDKLLDIFFSAIDALQKCKNKYDILRVLGMIIRHGI